MYRSSVSRFILSAALIAWGVALSAQPRAGAPVFHVNAIAASLPKQISPGAAPQDISLQLAGLPSADAAPGKRIFLTVSDDVYQNGALFIAAGARAKGFIRAIDREGDTLRLTIEMQNVQTAAGPQTPLNNRPIELKININDEHARYFPFTASLSPTLLHVNEAAVLYR